MKANAQLDHGSGVRKEIQVSVLDPVMERFEYQEHGLIEVLIAAQESFGFISEEVMGYISREMKIPLSQVYGVATFYDAFELDAPVKVDCVICTGPVCSVAGADRVLAGLRDYLGISKSNPVSEGGEYKVHEGSCLGLCDQAPAALINSQAKVEISEDSVEILVKGEGRAPELLVGGKVREITGSVGRISPTDLQAHLADGSFAGFEKAVFEMTPEEVIAEVKESRLSGRGGASFPTGLKWELARKAQGKSKYVVCNFDESEPGTFKDRVMMEGDPYRVLEGLMISAYATDASKGYVFIRGEYSKAQDNIEDALDELYAEGMLGEHVLDSDYDLDIEIRQNAGAYICGEETALFEAIEGKRGHPRAKPPYPTQTGLFGQPTAINNVETLAIVPSLILHGGEWFHQWGTENSVGLKLFCLSGHVNQPGVIEAPYGISVRDLVEEFGGGFRGEPQAVLVGGAAGGFLQAEELDVPLTTEDLANYDVPIGSGAIMVFNQEVDLWEVLEQLAHFFVHESCGKCSPCRIGTKQIYKALQNVNAGIVSELELRRAKKLGESIKATCVCGLGMTAANPFLSHMAHVAN